MVRSPVKQVRLIQLSCMVIYSGSLHRKRSQAAILIFWVLCLYCTDSLTASICLSKVLFGIPDLFELAMQMLKYPDCFSWLQLFVIFSCWVRVSQSVWMMLRALATCMLEPVLSLCSCTVLRFGWYFVALYAAGGKVLIIFACNWQQEVIWKSSCRSSTVQYFYRST